jgi:hypothetical protein
MTAEHNWSYFRAGGVVQVQLKNTADLLNLASLDQKLWMALAMPTRGVNCDPRTLDWIDTDRDGRIRPPEIIAALAFLDKTLANPGMILEDGDSIPISAFRDETIRLGAKRALSQLGKADADTISVMELELAMNKLSAEVFNGDGIIVAEGDYEHEVGRLIQDIIQHYGSVPDRSGKPGIDRTIVEGFFNELEARVNWFAELEQEPSLAPLGREQTALAFQANEQVRAKIEDFFTRCLWVAFDARADQAANRLETDYIAIAGQLLDANSEDLSRFPLAHIAAGRLLPLDTQLNPTWQKRKQDFVDTAVQSFLGIRPQALSEDQWQVIQKSLLPYATWRGREPLGKLGTWDIQKIKDILSSRSKQALEELLQFDLAMAPEYDSLGEVLKALIYRRDLGKILRNFVNFSDFYRREGAIFQSGTLFIDGRATELCIDVSNPARHLTMASLSGAYLVYCDCQRAGSTSHSIVALMTDGDSDNLMAGRNGVYYDNNGLDWDATITRILANPISLREAFWLPYKKLARFIEEQVAKKAAAAESINSSNHLKLGEAVLAGDKNKTLETTAPKKIDIGTVAAMGVALGSIGTFFGLMFGKFLDLGVLMPFGVILLMLLISGPSIVLAWLKLKSRNLGPILDSNGWAINTVARINVPFASSMTKLRTIPLRTEILLKDPYAEKKKPWKFYGIAALILLIILAWTMGRLDRYLPEKARSEHVFGAEKDTQKP